MRADAPSQTTSSQDKSGIAYSLTARRLHWATVALLAIQLPLGLFMVGYGERTNFAAPTAQMYDVHKLIGLAFLILIVSRLTYRLRNGAPAGEPTLEPWQKIVSHITHWALYAMLLVVPVLGWLAVSAYGPFAPFGIKLPGLLAQNDATATRLFDLHKMAAIAMAALIALHVGAALFHYVIRKDGVLNRMWPSLPRRDGN
jgi:cytochrome b561